MHKKIGIFSGTFDPVHIGHVEAALVAKGALGLDEVLLMVETNPLRKNGVADIQHRINMIELATADYPGLAPIDIEQPNVTTKNTLKFLQKYYPGDEYWLIVGSDTLPHIESWQASDKLFNEMNICVVARNNGELTKINKQIDALSSQNPNTQSKILPSVWSPVSSTSAKQALLNNKPTDVLHPKVIDYIKTHHLYDSLSSASEK